MNRICYLASVMFVLNAKDGACASYWSQNQRFDHVCSNLLFCLPPKFLDALKYFGLHMFAQRMDTDPVLTAMDFHRCSEVDWGRLLSATVLFRLNLVRVKSTG